MTIKIENEWFIALDCEDNVHCTTQDHGEAIAAVVRMKDYERGRVVRVVESGGQGATPGERNISVA